MITELEIKNFKCFACLGLPELSNFNIITGRNGVGKSALLEALFLFLDRTNAGMFGRHFGWRGIPRVPVSPDYYFGPAFQQLDLEQVVSITVKMDGEQVAASYAFSPDYTPPGRHGNQATGAAESTHHVTTSDERRSAFAIDATYTRRGKQAGREHIWFSGAEPEVYPDGPVPRMPLTRALFSRGRPSNKEEADLLSQVLDMKQGQKIEAFLKLVAPDLSDLGVSTAWGEKLPVCDIGLSRKLPVSLAGEGLSRLLSIILRVATSAAGIVLVDEIENGIHHTVQGPFWKALVDAADEYDCQVIVTTHSYEFVRNAHAALGGTLFEPRLRLIRLERTRGETRAKTLTYEMLDAALAEDWELR